MAMLTAAEVCEQLRIGRDKFRELVTSGRLAAIKTGDAPNSPYKVSPEALADYVARQAVPAGDAR